MSSRMAIPRAPSYTRRPASPRKAALAAAILNGGHRVAILAGQGALGAGDLLEQVAETLGMPENTVKTHLSRARAELRQAWIRSGEESR